MNEQQNEGKNGAFVAGSETAAPPKKKAHFEYTSGDRAMALGMFVLAFLAGDTFGIITDPGYYGVGVSITAVLFALSILAYARTEKRKLPGEGYFWLAVMILSALSYTFVYHQSLGWFHPVFLRLTVLYTVMVLLGALIGGKTSQFLLFDGINMLFIIPFSNYLEQWRIAHGEMKNMKVISALIKALLGLLAALPLLFVVTSLLSSADAQFGDLLVNITERLGHDVYRIICVFLGSLLTGGYLFGLFCGAAHKNGTDTFQKQQLQKAASACAAIPAASIYAVLFSVGLIYLLFIVLQGGYYLSALQGVLPEGFTYSEYARRGFFELVLVSLINLGVLGAATLLCQTRGKILKGFHVFLSIQTLFLIGTAMTKMYLYIDVYGLTPLRVIPSTFMIYLAVLFLLIIVKQFRPLPLTRISLLVFAAGYTILSLSDMDGRIAAYNLARYEAGTLTELSVSLLIDGSLASVPAIYQVWQQTQAEELKTELEGIVRKIAGNAVRTESKAWRYKSIQKYKAMKYIELMGQ